MSFDPVKKKNLIWYCAILIVNLLLLWVEGYVPLIGFSFWVYVGLVLAFDLWVILFKITFRRLLTLSLVGGVSGYLTQMVGVSQGIWRYEGIYQSYFFAAFVFMFAAICMYGISTSLLSRVFSPLHAYRPKGVNVFLVCVLLAVFVLTLEKPLVELSAFFWGYYLVLTFFAFYVSLRMNLKTLVSLVVAAWIVGNLSEYLGSQSGLWIFVEDNTYPPLFLVLGSWPLEFILHYSLSALLTGESLDA